MDPDRTDPSWRSGNTHGFCVTGRSRRLLRSQPVASALGSLVGRDPDLAVRTYHLGFSTTHQLGTFYLAGVRNFLFGSDTS